MTQPTTTRRDLILLAGVVPLAACAPRGADEPGGEGEGEGEAGAADGITANEDLMREHGLLARIMVIYDECLARLASSAEVPPAVVATAAGIVRTYVEDYHELLEEQHVFPRVENTNAHAPLLMTLRAQHQLGRRQTDVIRGLATGAGFTDEANRKQLADAMRGFNRMYRSHAAHEDTVLFPAFRKTVSAPQYAALGEQFAAREHELFGKDGFAATLDQVVQLERTLGIDDLGRFSKP